MREITNINNIIEMILKWKELLFWELLDKKAAMEVKCILAGASRNLIQSFQVTEISNMHYEWYKHKLFPK